MKKGFLLPLLLAVLAAIVYAMIVSRAEKRLNASANSKYVFVPTRDIKEREVIKRDFIKTVPVPAAYLQKDAFTYTTDADFKAIENAVARIQIPKGNQISKYAITSLSPEAGLSSKIPVQMRGFIVSDIPYIRISIIILIFNFIIWFLPCSIHRLIYCICLCYIFIYICFIIWGYLIIIHISIIVCSF